MIPFRGKRRICCFYLLLIACHVFKQIAKAQSSLVYYVGPTGHASASDSSGYGTTPEQPFATTDYAAKQLDGIGGTIILLDGEYYNDNFNDGDMWKFNQHSIRINNMHGTPTNPIIIKANSTDGHVLRGDAANIFQIRTSTHFIIEDLNIEGLVDSISLEDAWLHRFDYKIDADDTVYQREDPNATSAEIEGKTYPDISNLNILRPTLFTTNGLLVQSSRYITVRNCQVGYAPGTGLRVQSSDFVNIENNKVHNSSRRSSVGNHGMVIHSVTNDVGGDVVSDNGYRIRITGNEVYDNYNEVYSWSELKTFITPHIDEGKGITIQKTDASFDNGSGRILIANNVVYGNGFSGVHTNFATKVDIFHNTAVENTRTGKGVNTGISVSDSSDVNVINNLAYSTNDFGGNVYSTDMDDLAVSQITFASNIAVGNLSNRLDPNDFIVSTDEALLLQNTAPYRLASGSPAENVGDALTLSVVPLDKSGAARSNPPDLGAYEIEPGTLSPSSARPTLSSSPSMQPSINPSEQPSMVPSINPSASPSVQPSQVPSNQPSTSPTVVPSKIPSSPPSSVPSVSTEPSQNPSLQPSYDPDNKSNVGGLVVDILGQSGKMNLQNNNRTVQITIDALREVNANGDTVGNTGSVKHSINSFASQQFIFGIRDYYTTLFTFNSTTNETVPEAANGLRVDFSSTLDTNSRLKVQALLVSQGGITGDAQGNWTVSPGDFKWNIWFENWSWYSTAAYVELDIEVKGANAAPTQSNGDLTYDLGDDATLDLRSDYELSDGTSASMPDGYPRMTTQGSKTIFTFKFARHDGLDIKYDPLISFAAITETPSSSPSKEPSTSTSSPTMQPTPVSYRACRTKKANRNRKLCLKIPGCFWKNKKCQPKTPSPTAAPTISVEPTAPRPSATPTISFSPTTAGTPASWRSCRTKKANRKRIFCLKISGCVWRRKRCLHVDSI